MPVTLDGMAYTFQRVPTGLWSLDQLLADRQGNAGLPARTTLELYGYPGAGKSTLATALSGAFCNATGAGRVVIADLETAYAENHLVRTLENSGFDGVVKIVDGVDKKGKGRAHEDVLDEAIDSLLKRDDVGAVIIDSLGMIIPRAEDENDLGAANMGARAKLIAQMNRKILNNLRVSSHPQIVFQVNHQYEAMGSRGHITPGGNVKTYAVASRLSLYRKELFDDGTSLVQIRAEKVRLGGLRPKARAYVCIIPEFGVSWDLTAMFDCMALGLAERAASVKVMGEDYNPVKLGRISNLIDKAREGDHEPFRLFYWNLVNRGVGINEDETESSTESDRDTD